jgi:hypothetical protein
MLLGYPRQLDEQAGALYVIRFLHARQPCSGNPMSSNRFLLSFFSA